MKKFFAFFSCLMLFAGSVSAQDYNHAAGVRIGAYSGAFTYKQPLNSNAIEVMLWADWNSGFSVAGLYEWTVPIITDGFNLYYGAGAHLGVYSEQFTLGADVILGIEYKIPSVPIAVSFDYKPSLMILPEFLNAKSFSDFALGLKFTF